MFDNLRKSREEESNVDKFIREAKNTKRFLFTFRTFQFIMLLSIFAGLLILLGSLNQMYRRIYEVSTIVANLEYRVSLLKDFPDAISCKPLQDKVLSDIKMQYTNPFVREEAKKRGLLYGKEKK